MDNALIQLIARLKIRTRQEKGISLNTQKFFADPAYASQVLDAAEDSEDLELVSLSMEIRNKLGWLTATQAATPTKTLPSKPATHADQEKRYVFGARS